MKPVAAIDNGDHWYVVVDYSGSPRHAMLTAVQWATEFATHPSYVQMRASLSGVTGMMAPQGIGKWKKDWSGPYVP